MSDFGLKQVVAINKVTSDYDAEIDLLEKHCKELVVTVAVNDSWAQGGDGATELANKVVESVAECSDCFKPLYDLDWSFEKKIETIATKMYGAKDVEYTVKAKLQLQKINELGLPNLAVCIAKTQKSLSDNPKLLGRHKDFVITVREIEIAAGAGFLVPIIVNMMRMPGLPAHPASENINIDNEGNITGLF